MRKAPLTTACPGLAPAPYTCNPVEGEGGGGGEGELPNEKVGDACREFLFWPLRGTKKSVLQAFFRPLKCTKNGSIRNRKRKFRNRSLILSRDFTSLTPEPRSGTVSTLACYYWCLAPQPLLGCSPLGRSMRSMWYSGEGALEKI